jgi:MerR family transcriptional regulator, copper efflux regulator
MAETKANPLTIGRLASEVGINLETVRFYERQGLLPKPPRSASGYRLFPADAARRLRFIKRAQELGFSLTEIRELLALRTSPRTTSAEIRKCAEAEIADIEGKIKSLDSMRNSLPSWRGRVLDVGRSRIARFLSAWMEMMYGPHLEAKSIDSSRFGSLIATEIGLPFVLARLCRSSQ